MPFQTEADLCWQEEVGKRLEEAWQATLHPFGKLDEVDGWIERNERIWAVCEIKRRRVPSDRYPTIWVALRKWTSLMMIGQGFGVPGLFIVHYDDGIKWIEAKDCVKYKVVIGGRDDRGVPNDHEPVIDVPVGELRDL